MYTFGDIIDRLTIANIRLWHIEDDRRELQEKLKNVKEKKEIEDIKSKIVELADKVSKVNKERNSLIDQINESIKVISNKKKYLKLDKRNLLGHGKNKNYKTEE